MLPLVRLAFLWIPFKIHISFPRNLTTDYQANLPDSMILDGFSGRSAMCNIIARRRATPQPTTHHA